MNSAAFEGSVVTLTASNPDQAAPNFSTIIINLQIQIVLVNKVHSTTDNVYPCKPHPPYIKFKDTSLVAGIRGFVD